MFLIFSVDNSDYMRNGDFVPTRLQAQQDAVNLVCHSKTRSNPENNVGLLAFTTYVFVALYTRCSVIDAIFASQLFILRCCGLGLSV